MKKQTCDYFLFILKQILCTKGKISHKLILKTIYLTPHLYYVVKEKYTHFFFLHIDKNVSF